MTSLSERTELKFKGKTVHVSSRNCCVENTSLILITFLFIFSLVLRMTFSKARGECRCWTTAVPQRHLAGLFRYCVHWRRRRSHGYWHILDAIKMYFSVKKNKKNIMKIKTDCNVKKMTYLRHHGFVTQRTWNRKRQLMLSSVLRWDGSWLFCHTANKAIN